MRKSYSEVVPDFIAPIITKSGRLRKGDVISRNLFSFMVWIARIQEPQ